MVVRKDTGDKIWGTINYGWEDVEFYPKRARWKGSEDEMKGPFLDPLNPQTEHSGALLVLFKKVLRDAAYVERLKRHYEMFKGAGQQRNLKEPLSGRHRAGPIEARRMPISR